MFNQEKSTIYTYTTGDGYYFLIKVYDIGLVECYIYHGKVELPMFMFCYHLTRHRSLNNIIEQVKRDSNEYKNYYKSYIKNTRLHYIDF